MRDDVPAPDRSPLPLEEAAQPRQLGEGPARPGKVWLVGAGPGDPELLTVRATNLLAAAEVVAHDELVPHAILELAPSRAERIAVGRRAGGPCLAGGAVHPLVLVRAREGKDVLRLKGGDPYVFGRGGEETEELAAAGIPFEVVPGVTAVLALAARTCVPLTHRTASASVTLVTAYPAGPVQGLEHLAASVPRCGTIAVYMGLWRLDLVSSALIATGRSPDTPALVTSQATLPGERTVQGTLADIAALAQAASLGAPALLLLAWISTDH
ncbi:MAG: uroporphyrinogen-III C-methyltransferase [Deltaproteobacteria bacterium]|nr:uroporphyrinogen-III C-methyltransferase [Deltaproteobacteria bacterium]